MKCSSLAPWLISACGLLGCTGRIVASVEGHLSGPDGGTHPLPTDEAAGDDDEVEMGAGSDGGSGSRSDSVTLRDAGAPNQDAGRTQDAGSGTANDGGTQNAPVAVPWELAPMKLISVRRPVVASTGNASVLVNDTYFDLSFWDVAASASPWVSIDLGKGPSRIMVQLYSSQTTTAPGGYRLETSADSTNGRDGTWTTGLSVSGNSEQSRVHALDFAGKRWLRVTITAGLAGGSRVQLNEIGVRDASAGTTDSWIFLGDSITAMSFHPGQGTFAALVNKSYPACYPVMINEGVGGTNSGDGVMSLEQRLLAFADVQNWVIGYGTNDSSSTDQRFVTQYIDNMRRIITRLQQAGKNVYVPRIPYRDTKIEPYNTALDKLVSDTGAYPGPDFYAWFKAHPEMLGDGVHPNDQGMAAMNRMWVEAVSPLYK